MASIKTIADAHNLTMAEIALRWMSHHSMMKREYGDAILIGASNLEHMKQVGGICILRFEGTYHVYFRI